MYSSRFSRKLILLQPGRIISCDMCRWRRIVIVFVLRWHTLSVTLTYAGRSIQSAYIKIRGASIPQKGFRTGSTFTLNLKVTLFERNNLNLDVFGQDQWTVQQVNCSRELQSYSQAKVITCGEDPFVSGSLQVLLLSFLFLVSWRRALDCSTAPPDTGCTRWIPTDDRKRF